MNKIYLDHNASTPVAPEVVEAMQPFLREHFGNPPAGIGPAQQPSKRWDRRAQVAGLLGCQAEEIVFTSGGTEANNHAIKGAFFARAKGNHIITTQIEHPAVLKPCHFLERLGAEVTCLPWMGPGGLTRRTFAAITPRTILVSVMHANNEVGTIQPIRKSRELRVSAKSSAHRRRAIGRQDPDACGSRCGSFVCGGHNCLRRKGRRALCPARSYAGTADARGGHESGRRAGTENVLLDVGLGAACALAATELDWRQERQTQRRDYFHTGLKKLFGPGVHLNGHPTQRLPNTLNVSFDGHTGNEVLEMLGDVAASTGSACHSGSREISSVLRAMGVSEEIGLGAVRFSLGRGTTSEEIDEVLDRFRYRVQR